MKKHIRQDVSKWRMCCTAKFTSRYKDNAAALLLTVVPRMVSKTA